MISKDSKFCLVNAKSLTASVFIDEDESGLHHDSDHWLAKLVPHEAVSPYHHNGGEDKADAPMKRQIMGQDSYGKFDGRRKNADGSGSLASKGGPRP